LVAESGALLAQVRAVKDMGRQHFVLVNAGFSDLVRPAMYGGYHGIAVLPGAGSPALSERRTRPCVVAGPLCESGDVFTQAEGGDITPRELPSPQVGDWLVFEDAGAYGASMSSNYNSRPLIAEALLEGASARLIRRRQSLEALLALEDELGG
jgi:diaminopimelate decarboxylase